MYSSINPIVVYMFLIYIVSSFLLFPFAVAFFLYKTIKKLTGAK